jgi:RHH-type transcriptional regulator, rel operon repressor / antitoxin RelB
MPDTNTVMVRLDAALKTKLEALSKSTQRSKSWFAAEAIAAYVDREAWQIEQIEETIEQADRPNAEWVSHEKALELLNTSGDGDEMSALCP